MFVILHLLDLVVAVVAFACFLQAVGLVGMELVLAQGLAAVFAGRAGVELGHMLLLVVDVD